MEGDYERQWRQKDIELEQRALAIIALGAINMPVWEDDGDTIIRGED